MLEVFHQLGANSVWNIDAHTNEAIGDGLIISPRHLPKEKVEILPQPIKERSIFDPQFFNPKFCKGQLVTYPFHPENITKGFDTSTYSPEQALASARGCVSFQVQNRFRYLIIPTRYVPGMASTYIQDVDNIFIRPFIQAIQESQSSSQILLQLILTDQMIKDPQYSQDLLNWITSPSNIAGVYLITEVQNRNKQIKDYKFLSSYLSFIRRLRDNGMLVVLGYTNTEALLYSIADPQIVTVGSYENTRIFNYQNFCESDSDQRGPNPRLYTTKLLHRSSLYRRNRKPII